MEGEIAEPMGAGSVTAKDIDKAHGWASGINEYFLKKKKKKDQKSRTKTEGKL